MAAPETHTITDIPGPDKIVVQGFHAELDVLPKGQLDCLPGEQIKGWLNPDGKYGPFFKLAREWRVNGAQSAPTAPSQPVASQADGDPQRRSIERQVAVKCATELMRGREMRTEAFAREFHFLTDTIYDAIQG